MSILSRIPVAIRPALLAAALLSASSRLPAQHNAARAADEAPLIPVTTHWPSRKAIAVVEAAGLHPLTVEATSDGWIVLSPLSYYREDADAVPAMRLHLAPEDVHAWTTAVRALGAPAVESATPIHDIALPRLGRGRVYLAPHVRDWRGSMVLNLVDCDGVPTSVSMRPSDLTRFAAELERATDVVRRTSAHASLPALERPYYASEVSCGAELREARILPSFPRSIAPDQRRYTEVGVRFVVDTAGFVEAGSVALLRGAPDAYARATEDVVRSWRFRPAEFSGSPVRQIVTTVVAFDPLDVARRTDPDRILGARHNDPRDAPRASIAERHRRSCGRTSEAR
jgi:hypothetical protein